MPNESDFEQVFQRLKAILQAHADQMIVKIDSPTNYYLDAAYDPKLKRALFFGAVEIKKNYVSFHLMPLYIFPEMADTLSPELKKRKQGKACFNFVRVDEGLFGELAELTRRGMEKYQAEKYL